MRQVYLEAVEIEFLKSQSRPKLYLRPAQFQDEGLVLTWKNSNHVRQFSVNGEFISENTHHAWFQNRIKIFDESPCFVACIEGTDVEVGFLRLDRISSSSLEIGILIERESTGKGFGKESLGLLVSEAIIRFQPVNLVARIASSNNASIALFEQAGFELTERDPGNGFLIYQLTL
jgi:RimJ/RimL family protein N-acetyltransferase